MKIKAHKYSLIAKVDMYPFLDKDEAFDENALADFAQTTQFLWQKHFNF